MYRNANSGFWLQTKSTNNSLYEYFPPFHLNANNGQNQYYVFEVYALKNCGDANSVKAVPSTVVIFLKATKGKYHNRMSLKQQRFLKMIKVKVS